LLSFRGDFAPELKNEQYIYRSGRGKTPESVRDFTDRIKEKWKNAVVQNSSDPIPAQYEDSLFTGQYIRITTLMPTSMDEMNGGLFKWENTKAPLRMKKYYRENETNVFSYTYQKKIDKAQKGDNEFRTLWITKVYLVSSDVIPSLRRRMPVIQEKKFNLHHYKLQLII